MNVEDIYGSVAQSYSGSNIDDIGSFINDIVFVYTYDKVFKGTMEATPENAAIVEYDIRKLAIMVSERFNEDEDEVLNTIVSRMIGPESDQEYIVEIARKEQPHFCM